MGIIKSGIKKIKDTYDYVASGGNKRKKRVRRGRVNIKATATSTGSAAIRAARQAKPKTPAQSSATTRMQGSKAKKWIGGIKDTSSDWKKHGTSLRGMTKLGKRAKGSKRTK